MRPRASAAVCCTVSTLSCSMGFRASNASSARRLLEIFRALREVSDRPYEGQARLGKGFKLRTHDSGCHASRPLRRRGLCQLQFVSGCKQGSPHNIGVEFNDFPLSKCPFSEKFKSFSGFELSRLFRHIRGPADSLRLPPHQQSPERRRSAGTPLACGFTARARSSCIGRLYHLRCHCPHIAIRPQIAES